MKNWKQMLQMEKLETSVTNEKLETNVADGKIKNRCYK